MIDFEINIWYKYLILRWCGGAVVGVVWWCCCQRLRLRCWLLSPCCSLRLIADIWLLLLAAPRSHQNTAGNWNHTKKRGHFRKFIKNILPIFFKKGCVLFYPISMSGLSAGCPSELGLGFETHSVSLLQGRLMNKLYKRES